jgi:alkylation response protein AidB-like acyl-CoA dehydrogenase
MTTHATVDTLLYRVKQIAPIIGDHAAEAEEKRRLSRPVVDAMLEAGLYDMSRPRAFGGLEADPITMFRVIEEVARHDSAAGWNLQLSLGALPFLAWLPDEGVEEILSAQPSTIVGGSFTPGRQAIAEEGGYRLTGQWPFVSGGHDCHWLVLLPQVVDGDTPRVTEQGVPVQRLVYVPADKTTFLDNWHTLGMRGTGSNDVVLSDVFVPERYTAPLAPLENPAKGFEGPLYRGLTVWVPIAMLAPPALGIARAAVDGLIELARVKTPSFNAAILARRQVVQRQVAEAEATLGAGRAYLFETFRDNWEAALRGEPLTQKRKINMQLATSHAVVSAAKAVDLVHAAAGASAIRNEYKFQKWFRDVHTLTQHAFASASRYESAGALMLGVESDWGFFAF